MYSGFSAGMMRVIGLKRNCQALRYDEKFVAIYGGAVAVLNDRRNNWFHAGLRTGTIQPLAMRVECVEERPLHE